MKLLGGAASLLLVSLSHSAAAAAPAKSATAAAPEPIALIRGTENHLLIPATVNGKPATFLLDTGDQHCFLQKSRAEAFGVRRLGRKEHLANRWFEAASADELRIGTTTFSRVEFALYDPAEFHGPVPGKNGRPADGLIGLELLRRSKAIINCRTQQLFLQSNPARALDLDATTKQAGFTRIPLSLGEDGVLTVPCSIHKKPGRLVLDTGAFVTVFDQAAMRTYGVKESPSQLRARTPSGRVRSLQLAQFDDLRIGNLPIAPQKLAVMDLYARITPVRAFLGINTIQAYDERLVRVRRDVIGLLGSELLYERSAIIDVGKMALYLK
ncbi:MAG: aspartyl protease family protein [Chthoniobacterales bacterium]